MKRWQTLVLGLIISAVALYFAFRQANLGAIVNAFRHANYTYVGLSAALVLITVSIRGLRWMVLTQRRLSFADAFWLFNIGFLFNNFLPARLGEIARAVLAGRRPQMHFTSALSSIIVERLFDMIAVVVMIGLILLVLPLPSLVTTAGALMGAAAVIGIVALALAARYPEPALKLGSGVLAILPRIDQSHAEQFLRPFVQGLSGVSDLRVFVGGLLLSLIAWIGSGIAAWVLMFAFWPGEPLIMGMVAVVAAGLGIAVPAAPSGVGPFEAAVFAALTSLKRDPDLSRSYALALHGVNFMMTSLLGLIGLLREGTSFGEVARAAETAVAHPSMPSEVPPI
jgi:glycosyltransferase 2 family protein